MQIHELTKRRKERTDEGLLDSFKDAITAAQTGFRAGASAGTKSPNVAGTAGAVGALSSPTAGAIASNQNALNAAEKSRQEINKKYGLDIQGAKRGAGEMFAGQQQDNELKKQAATITQQFVTSKDTAPIFTELSDVLPDPGQMLTVTMNGANYFKDENGKWYAEAESNLVPPKQITTDASIKSLNDIIDSDKYKQVPSIFNKTVSEAANPGMNKASALKLAKQTAMRQANSSIVAKKYRTSASQVTKNPTVAQQIKQAEDELAKVSSAKRVKGKKQKVKQAYQNLAYVTLKGMQEIGTGQVNSTSTQPGQTTATPAAANPQEKAAAAQTITQSGVADGAKLVQAAEKNPPLKQALATITKESFDKKLNEALSLIGESQVAITKDIVIRTTKGNYVKSHIDQQWRDPNGTVIDPVKYADYIKKLDATPAAQTRYQADAKNAKGSDTAMIKQQAANQEKAQSATIKATPALIQQATQNPDPVQQIADQDRLQAILRARNVEALNALTQDTFNQLQNAKIFKTGQEDYLNDRLKALMAMKA